MTFYDLNNLVDYNYWARDRVLAAVSALTPDQFTCDLGNSFSSVRDTIAHIYLVFQKSCEISRVTQGGFSFSSRKSLPCPGFYQSSQSLCVGNVAPRQRQDHREKRILYTDVSTVSTDPGASKALLTRENQGRFGPSE